MPSDGGATGVYGAKYARQLKRPLLVSLTGRDVTDLLRPDPYNTALSQYRSALPELWETASAFLLPTPELLELAGEVGFPRERLLLHFPGVDLQQSQFVVDQSRFAPRDRDAILVMKGRFVPESGHIYGLRAFQKIALKYRAHLVLVGEGPLEQEIQSSVATLELTQRVTLLPPWDPDVPLLLNSACIALAPSVVGHDHERDSRARFVMEAAAMGIPVVATAHGANTATVEDGVTGYLVGERDVLALADRVAHLLDSPQECAAFAKAGRAKMELEFALSKTSKHLMSIYRFSLNASS